MSNISDETLAERLRELLSKADMEKTSERMLRRSLEEEFGVSFSDRKAFIRDEVKKFLEGSQDEECNGNEDLEDEGEAVPAAQKAGSKRKGTTRGSQLSKEMQEFLGVDSMARKDVTKEIWAYIKQHKLQDPANKKNIILDDKLQALFTEPLTMLTIAKQLSKHVWAAGDKVRRTGESNSGVNSSKSPRKSGDNATDASFMSPAAKRKTGGFSKPIKVSPDLAEFLGTEEISRPELTKFMWAYFKNNELQDPNDRRHILCDDKLKSLMKVDRFQAFGFMKHLKDHIVS